MEKKPLEEDVAANSVAGGGVAMFSPVMQFKDKKKKMSELLRRWLEGR